MCCMYNVACLYVLVCLQCSCIVQGADGSDSGKVTPRSLSPNPTPPTIPPLPINHHDLNKHTPERKGSVAKIISQFQEAAKNSPNVIKLYLQHVCRLGTL